MSDKIGERLLLGALALGAFMVILLVVLLTHCVYREIFSEKIELVKSEWICSESKRVWTGKTYDEHCIVYKQHE